MGRSDEGIGIVISESEGVGSVSVERVSTFFWDLRFMAAEV